jgi:hypothetical protein
MNGIILNSTNPRWDEFAARLKCGPRYRLLPRHQLR